MIEKKEIKQTVCGIFMFLHVLVMFIVSTGRRKRRNYKSTR
jgi:hypothetical protein